MRASVVNTGRREAESRRIGSVSSYGLRVFRQPSLLGAFVSVSRRPATALVVSGMVPLTGRIVSMP